jgi:predicted adenine nucleotide alpha hydrolase (AANH) superfamily ATPase
MLSIRKQLPKIVETLKTEILFNDPVLNPKYEYILKKKEKDKKKYKFGDGTRKLKKIIEEKKHLK